MSETITITKAVLDGDKKISEVVLDLDGLTGQDLATAEREYLTMGGVPTNLNASISFLQHVAARACGVNVDVVRMMSAKDSTYLTTRCQLFLLDMDLPKMGSDF